MRDNWTVALCGKAMQLVPYCRHHVEKYHRWMSDPVLLLATASDPLSLDEEYAMQKEWHKNPKNCTFIILVSPNPENAHDGPAAEDQLDEEEKEAREISRMVGDVNLFMHDHDDPGNAEIEIMIADEASRGKGIGCEALRLMMNYAVSCLHITRFFAKIHETNETSLKLFETTLGYRRVNYAAAFQEWELELLVAEEGNAARIAQQAAHATQQVYHHRHAAHTDPVVEARPTQADAGPEIQLNTVFGGLSGTGFAKLPQLPAQETEVYEPSDDTFLLCDALEQDRAELHALSPNVALEIGSGSGCVITFLGLLLKARGRGGDSTTQCLATDINPIAVRMTAATARLNGVEVEVIQTRLVQGMLSSLERRVDVLVFNPPYVPTPDDEVGGTGIEASWAGGERGRVVIDEFLPLLPELLSERGRCYLVLVQDNEPADIARILGKLGLAAQIVLKRQAFNESLQIMRITRP